VRDGLVVLAAGVMGRAFWAIWYLLGCARSADLCGRYQFVGGPGCGASAGRQVRPSIVMRALWRSSPAQLTTFAHTSSLKLRSLSRGKCTL